MVHRFVFSGIFSMLAPCCLTAQGVQFERDFSPAQGLLTPQEMAYRQEMCLNGYWQVQLAPIPEQWKEGSGEAPQLPPPSADRWEEVQIKIPSPINVNNWGGGWRTGDGTDLPYAPSSVYYPSYPESWVHARMAYLKKSIPIPSDWKEKRIILHFEAVAGECTVLINGKEAGRNFESHLPFEVDITNHIIPGKANEVLLALRHTKLFDKRHRDYRYFGATYPTGSNTDDLLGIWQDVFLFALPQIHIADVFVKPNVSENQLEVEITVQNATEKKQTLNLNGNIYPWQNKTDLNAPAIDAAEINWQLGETAAMSIAQAKIELKALERKTITLKQTVSPAQLQFWTPDSPCLYSLLLNLSAGKTTIDSKSTRFGWRQFSIVGDAFHLNGKKIQCFGDIQHPFGAYICSRRFAFAWYKMIKDFGGNAVRPHAQPWPRVYYDLADEMGLMVLDETALFGSSIRLNLEEEITWQRSYEHLRRLIERDRNHPSVIGWSAGNEMFAIALLNKPDSAVAKKWDNKLADLALSVKKFDNTRDFITLDGDRDMDGRLPVWSKHFGHGLQLQDLPAGLNKPLVVGESGATYYGRPIQLYPFVGDSAFESYSGRNYALAIDVYQNAVKMALPRLAYYSPSEVCWFGIEHLPLGYSHYERLPNMQDGIIAGKPYREGLPGYQFERIPPYVSTFNPGLDPALPLYKPLPMFNALKAALTGETPDNEISSFSPEKEYKIPDKTQIKPLYTTATFVGDTTSILYKNLKKTGISFTSSHDAQVIFVDAQTVGSEQIAGISKMKNLQKKGGVVWYLLSDSDFSPAAQSHLQLKLTARSATSLVANRESEPGKYFSAPDLYFAEEKGDRKITKQCIDIKGRNDLLSILLPANVDWTLFNEQPENRKCAQIVLYEHLQKTPAAACVQLPILNEKVVTIVSTLDYHLDTPHFIDFWQKLFTTMGIKWNNISASNQKSEKRTHDLLLDGPVD